MGNEKVIAEYLSGRRPDGLNDKGGRWYPSEAEKCSCCRAIRSPSRSFPFSLLNHCQTKKHILKLIEENPASRASVLHKDIETALTITDMTAPLHVNDESPLIRYVIEVIYGHRKK